MKGEIFQAWLEDQNDSSPLRWKGTGSLHHLGSPAAMIAGTLLSVTRQEVTAVEDLCCECWPCTDREGSVSKTKSSWAGLLQVPDCSLFKCKSITSVNSSTQEAAEGLVCSRALGCIGSVGLLPVFLHTEYSHHVDFPQYEVFISWVSISTALSHEV